MRSPHPSDPLERIALVVERLALTLGAQTRDLPDEEPASIIAWRTGPAGFEPIRHPDLVPLERLVGIETAAHAVRRNTERFVAGQPANDVLLWGDRGTGKSSLIKAMLTLFHLQGLRMIEVARDRFTLLPRLAEWVANKTHRYIVYIDDLSFEPGETGYRELKSLLEGGLTARPSNLLVYATSNRRHLLPERFRDQDNGDDIHPHETLEEKIALADRFGLRIGLYAPNQETYLKIVDRYADQFGVNIARDELHRKAIQFALQAGHRSGRAAIQFIRSIAGQPHT